MAVLLRRPAPSPPSTQWGCSPTRGDHFAVADFWRFIVVHLWVEDFLELFTTVMVAYLFVLLGVVRSGSRMTVIFLDIILYCIRRGDRDGPSPVLHGEPAEVTGPRRVLLGPRGHPAHVPDPRGVELPAARRRAAVEVETPFPHRWAVMFLVAVGFWNFLGAGSSGSSSICRWSPTTRSARR